MFIFAAVVAIIVSHLIAILIFWGLFGVISFLFIYRSLIDRNVLEANARITFVKVFLYYFSPDIFLVCLSFMCYATGDIILPAAHCLEVAHCAHHPATTTVFFNDFSIIFVHHPLTYLFLIFIFMWVLVKSVQIFLYT